MARCWVTAGLLRWREVRDVARRVRWLGHDIETFESSGWLERRFEVKGSNEAVRLVLAGWDALEESP